MLTPVPWALAAITRWVFPLWDRKSEKKNIIYPWCLERSLSDTWSLILRFHGRKCWKVSSMSPHAFNWLTENSDFFSMRIVYHIIDKPIKGVLWFTLKVRSFGVIWIRICDSSSLRSWYIKGTDESTLVTNSSAPFRIWCKMIWVILDH